MSKEPKIAYVKVNVSAPVLRHIYTLLEDEATPHHTVVRRLKKGLYEISIKTEEKYFQYFRNLLTSL